jgi:exopolysaccharide biosynthesis polyprenyl glycosylphosphotransferase
MTPSNRKAILDLVQIGDVVLLFCSLGAAYSLIAHRGVLYLLTSLETHRPIQVFAATLILGWAWHVSLTINGFYGSHRLDGFLKESIDACSGTSLCVFFSAIWLGFVCVQSAHRIGELLRVSALFGVLSAVCFVITRLIARTSMHALRSHGHNLRHILIIGTNRRADAFARDIDFHPEWGYHLLGFVDEQWWYEKTGDHDRRTLLGGFAAIPDLLRALPVDEVIVTLPIASFYQQVASIVTLCSQHGIAVRTVGNFFEFDQRIRSSFLGGAAGTMTLHDESRGGWATLIKRTSDFVISLTLLVALSPVLLIVALLIKLTSPGPVLFIQTRMGFGKRPFKIFKFRTMVQDAEKQMAKVEHLNETQGPTFKLKNDPRITPLGKFLRKTSLDEIPQLINVLIGDMSLVGPRPLPLRDYEGFSEDWHRRRFSVKPGITCLWQIMGRSSIGFEEWMALDMRYIDQWSVWLDVKILFQTIPAVFRGSGAV